MGEGCYIDQIVAQWHSNLFGLGEIFDPKQTKKALQSIYKYNFKKSMRNHYNPCRLYAVNDEAGSVIKVSVFYGNAYVKTHVFKPLSEKKIEKVMCGEESINFTHHSSKITLSQFVIIDRNNPLVIAIDL